MMYCSGAGMSRLSPEGSVDEGLRELKMRRASGNTRAGRSSRKSLPTGGSHWKPKLNPRMEGEPKKTDKLKDNSFNFSF